MEKKEKIRLSIIYVFIFLFAVFMDMQQGELRDESYIVREDVGGDEKEVDLILNVDGVLEEYPISIEVSPRKVTKDEADVYIKKAIENIEIDFQNIENDIPLKKEYISGIVQAEWTFSPAGIIGTNGELERQNIPEEGMLINATVILSCDAYEQMYCFPFRVEKPRISKKEAVEEALDSWMKNQQILEGEEQFQLPVVLDGAQAEWGEQKEYLSIKIFLLELLSVVLILLAKKKEQEEMIKRKQQERERIYPDVLNQLLILLEAGMTTRQAWHRITEQYKEKKKKQLVTESEVYEVIMQMDRRLLEGEKERTAYEVFAQQMNTICYRRLARLLINNLEKGSKDICQQLSLEAKQAYEQRLLMAKKWGEEASAKMLIPLMLMMIIVMVIVMAPAIIGFAI